MLTNYLKIAWRNLTKHKTFGAINIIGVAVGLACFLLIALYVMDELAYDRYNATRRPGVPRHPYLPVVGGGTFAAAGAGCPALRAAHQTGFS